MEMSYKFYEGSDRNPYEKELLEARKALVDEAVLVMKQEAEAGEEGMPLTLIMPTLEAWPDYVVARSKDAFWHGEKDFARDAVANAQVAEGLWREANANDEVGVFLKDIDADENSKALCYYLAMDYARKCPSDKVVDFRLYFTEAVQKIAKYTLEAYEDW